jgi:hypothetical protein
MYRVCVVHMISSSRTDVIALAEVGHNRLLACVVLSFVRVLSLHTKASSLVD